MKPSRFAIFPLILILLTSCSSSEVKKNLGLSKKAPDEFRVVPRPPLSVPPEFTLRPPSKDEDAARFGSSPYAEAKEMVLGAGANEQTLEDKQMEGTADTAVPAVTSSTLESSSEAEFMKQIGTSDANPQIRDTLRKEQSELREAQEEEDWWAGWWPGKNKKNESTVDPRGEAARIRTNKDEGKPITEGETPTEEKKAKPLLDKMLGN